eukprot:3555633-Pyramimonas_sp.AAC.1
MTPSVLPHPLGGELRMLDARSRLSGTPSSDFSGLGWISRQPDSTIDTVADQLFSWGRPVLKPKGA